MPSLTPASDLRNELLPAPFLPITATISFAKILAESSLSAIFWLYFRDKDLIEILGSDAGISLFAGCVKTPSRISVVMRRISRTDRPTSFNPSALAK